MPRDQSKLSPTLYLGVRLAAGFAVIVSGASVNTPVLLRVRTRITRHGGTDLDAPDAWLRWFDEGEPEQEARDGALFVEKKVKYEEDGDVLWA